MKNKFFSAKRVLVRRAAAILIAVVCAAVLAGCGGSGDKGDTAQAAATAAADKSVAASDAGASASYDDIYKEVTAADHMPVEEAYEKLKDTETSSAEQEAFVQKLKDLIDCSGKFANTGESGNRYSADVAFYLSSGEVYNTTSYTGYRGEIKDGAVSETKEAGYLFQSEPKGDLFGTEQDFQLYFGKEQLHIMWADTCDYVLDRGDGSIESVEDRKVPFDQTDTYAKIEEILDKNFESTRHEMVYVKEKRELNVYFQAPDKLRTAIDTRDQSILDTWGKLKDSMTDFSNSMLTAAKISGDVDYVNIYWVDQLNSSNEYSQSDYLIWIQNGVVMYNYADESSGPSAPSSQQKPGSNSSGDDTDSSSNSGGGPATFGEQNALEKAHQYLNYSAFSYTGLIEQLEFEGFSHSEAVYAADNCGADWNEQAVKKAQQYLDYSSFSRSELLDQLVFEGFTQSQAEYAVNKFY